VPPGPLFNSFLLDGSKVRPLFRLHCGQHSKNCMYSSIASIRLLAPPPTMLASSFAREGTVFCSLVAGFLLHTSACCPFVLHVSLLCHLDNLSPGYWHNLTSPPGAYLTYADAAFNCSSAEGAKAQLMYGLVSSLCSFRSVPPLLSLSLCADFFFSNQSVSFSLSLLPIREASSCFETRLQI
jgi:hypothetical protein